MTHPSLQPTPSAGFVPSAFQKSLTASMMDWRASEVDGQRSPMWSDWLDGIHASLRGQAQAYVEASGLKLHDFAAALASSQIFAFNLFLPFTEPGARERLSRLVSRAIGSDFEIETIDLEWVPPGALLGEIRGDRPDPNEPATGVDVVLWGRCEGRKAAALVEVKLSESGFTRCGGAASKANTRAHVCASAEAFLHDPTQCYLQRPARATRDRRYWEIFSQAAGSVTAAFPGLDPTGRCPFEGEMQQPMRNLAVAIGLQQAGGVERSWFVLCAHDGNPDVPAHWAKWQALLAPQMASPYLLASEVVAAGADAGLVEWASWMSRRYRLPLKQLRYARAPSASFLRELSPGGSLAFLLHAGSVAGTRLDVHLREQDHLHIYCGLTRLVDVRFAGDRIVLTAHRTYRQQQPELFTSWPAAAYPLLQTALAAYLARVVVNRRFTGKEGSVQAGFAHAQDLPWRLLDREAVIGYSTTPLQKAFRSFPAVMRARSGAGNTPMGDTAGTPAELDVLGVEGDGTLALIELKHSAASSTALTQAPLQLLQYVWEWHAALPSLLPQLQALLDARVALGLMPTGPRLNGRLRGWIGIDEGLLPAPVNQDLAAALAIANSCLPAGVPALQVLRRNCLDASISEARGA